MAKDTHISITKQVALSSLLSWGRKLNATAEKGPGGKGKNIFDQ